jgi:cellulose 1,4-beta-cellobiosidase
MPPDMSAAKIVVLYKCDQRQSMGSSVAMTLYLKNQTDAAYDLSNVTVRYWMSSEPPPRPERYHSAANLSSSIPVFVPNMAVSYLEWSFGAAGTLPAYVDQNTLNNNGVIQAGVQSNLGVAQFNQANDWSFDATAMAAKENPKITVYDGDTLIWGCEPSQVCAVIEPDPTGEAGAGGQSSL